MVFYIIVFRGFIVEDVVVVVGKLDCGFYVLYFFFIFCGSKVVMS